MGWFGGTIFFGNIQLVKVEGCVPVRCVETALPWCFTDGWFFLFSVLIIFSSLGGGVVPSNPKFAPILSLGVNLHMITKSFAFSKGVTNFARCKWSWLLFPQSKKWRKNVGYSDIPLLVLAGSSKIYSPAWVEQKSHCWQHSNLLNLLSYIRISSLKLTAKAPEIESWNTIVPKLGLQIFRGFCS